MIRFTITHHLMKALRKQSSIHYGGSDKMFGHQRGRRLCYGANVARKTNIHNDTILHI
jgi:cysteinyl-tRNA synthetase